MAVMKPRSRPSRSASPDSSASRRSRRVRWKTACRVLAVTIDGLPCRPLTPSEARPSRSRCRWSAANWCMCCGGQHRGVVAAAGSADLQEGAQLQAGPPHVVEGRAAARAARRPQHAGEVVPEQVTQPPLGHPGQVDAAGAAGQPPPEVLGEDVSLLPRLLRRHVEGCRPRRSRGRSQAPPGRPPRAGRHRPGPARSASAGRARGRSPPAAAAGASSHRPCCLPGVRGHAPLDLGPQQRMQARAG